MILHISSIKLVGSWVAAAAAVLNLFLLAGRIIQARFSVVFLIFLFFNSNQWPRTKQPPAVI